VSKALPAMGNAMGMVRGVTSNPAANRGEAVDLADDQVCNAGIKRHPHATAGGDRHRYVD